MPIVDADSGATGRYAEFGDTPGGLHLDGHKVEHESRVHVDIESDDIDATRLEALRATRVTRSRR
ncbi:hypothetical protein [Cognatilysobacter bugurensis]|uniref:Uncharacterized protein n=1 Tax=Cognatilysobacter bugurensis TaxID=543356 RepID=A0A918WB37_9GAMM|nr:hypothetical protein [Lysobacter bugurensis]GHA86086.1 hypothetical protein GCM10007067_25170 [Lysobacter bugurensis]